MHIIAGSPLQAPSHDTDKEIEVQKGKVLAHGYSTWGGRKNLGVRVCCLSLELRLTFSCGILDKSPIPPDLVSYSAKWV